MSTNNRRKPRKSIGAVGFIYTIDGWPIGECKTLDMSETGAKLLWMSDQEVPPEFFLSFSRDAKVRRRCQVKWHEAEKIGVRFVVT
jgi:hypothetical protein